MKQIDLREGARRQHRAVALFAVVQCWLRDLDGLVFDRRDLERLLGLERFKRTRVEWMQEDFEEFFPYQKVFWMSNARDSLYSFYVSRSNLDGILPDGEMSDEIRIEGIPKNGPRLSLFKMWGQSYAEKVLALFEDSDLFSADAVNCDERLLHSYLALLAQGQISPRSLPSLRKSESAVEWEDSIQSYLDNL